MCLCNMSVVYLSLMLFNIMHDLIYYEYLCVFMRIYIHFIVQGLPPAMRQVLKASGISKEETDANPQVKTYIFLFIYVCMYTYKYKYVHIQTNVFFHSYQHPLIYPLSLISTHN